MVFCFGQVCTEYCHPTIWNPRTPREALQKHKLKVNIFIQMFQYSTWLLHYAAPFTSSNRKEYNSTLAYAGPKSSHHL